MKLLFVILIIACTVQAVNCSDVPYSTEIWKAFSIAALVLAVPHHVIFKSHLRMLDLLQLAYLFFLPNFFNSYGLAWSWVTFIPSFWTSLIKYNLYGSSYLNQAGYLLSIGVCLAGVVLIAWIVFSIVKCCKKTKKNFLLIFNYFKGFIRWIYIGLVFFSVNIIINSTYIAPIQKQTIPQNIVAPSIVLFICLLYPIFQLIQRSLQQKNSNITDPMKWIQLFSLLRLFLISSLFIIDLNFSKYIRIAIYIVQAVYFITCIIFQTWDNIIQCIFFTITESVIVVLLSLSYFQAMNDITKIVCFSLIVGSFGIQFLYQIFKYIRWILSLKRQQIIFNQQHSLIPIISQQVINEKSQNKIHHQQVYVQMKRTSKKPKNDLQYPSTIRKKN